MRRILDEQYVPPDDREQEPVRLALCGPSDRHPEENQDVLIVEWRSPMGDDLRLTLAREFVARFVEHPGPPAGSVNR